MPVPLYGFLQGDTVGLLILAEEAETLQALARKFRMQRAFGSQPTGCDEELKNSNANDFIPSFCPRRPAYRRNRTSLKTQAAMGV
jgi:hypothetical protein